MDDDGIVLDPNDRLATDPLGRRIWADDGTDLTLLRSFLKLTPTERLRHLQSMTNLVERVRRPSNDD